MIRVPVFADTVIDGYCFNGDRVKKAGKTVSVPWGHEQITRYEEAVRDYRRRMVAYGWLTKSVRAILPRGWRGKVSRWCPKRPLQLSVEVRGCHFEGGEAAIGIGGRKSYCSPAILIQGVKG